MKSFLSFLLAMLAINFSNAQTQKELEALMKQAQQEMENLDPEARRMMDSLGIQLPSFNNLPSMTDAQLAEAYEAQNRIVPVKDAKRIATISKVPLTSASLPAYLASAQRNVSAKLKPASKAKGEEIYQALKAQSSSSLFMANSAAGLWMMGKTELALYVMGRASSHGPSDANMLNNYASMLSMSGAEHLAIPMLAFVNKRFTENSTVLNNIGQAWFGLGDITKASAYLDSALRLFPGHAQANFTKSFIQESKGNKTAAIAAMKRSIHSAYSPEKQSRLDQLGYDLTRDDVGWHERMPQDPLGLEKFVWPAYPLTVSEIEIKEKEWNSFREKCEAEMDVLRSQLDKLVVARDAAMQDRTRRLLRGGVNAMSASPIPPLAPKAIVKLQHLVVDKDGHRAFTLQSRQQAMLDANENIPRLEQNMIERLKEVDKAFDPLFGEGKANPFEQACEAENKVIDGFLTSANSSMETATRDYLNVLRRKLNDEVYYAQYTQWSEEFEVTKINAKIMWLGAIHGQKAVFRSQGKWCQRTPERPERPLALAAFDDVHCMYHSELVTPVGTIRTDCSRVTTTLDLKVIKLGLKQDMERETFGDQFMTCSVEVGVGTGAGVNMGPLKAEASIGGGVRAEFDRSGLTDVIVKASASVEAGSDIIKGGSMAGVGVSDLSLDLGVKGQISLVSGKSSVDGTGLLSGVSR